MNLDHLPTAGGYDVIQTPAQIHGSQLGRTISTPEQLLAIHAAELKQHHKHEQWRYEQEVPAFISRNRWYLHCPHCRGGVSCGPAWPIACCFECGAVFDHVWFPENWKEIEAVLLARPALDNRHWLLGETLEQLIEQNVSRGLAPARGGQA